LWAEGINAKNIHKKWYLFMVQNVCHLKWFTSGLRNSLKGVRKSQMMPDQVQEWLRQQAKDFCTAGFDALVKQWDKCMNVGENVKKYMFFPGSKIMFYIHL
jgi:hypothetical protein